MVADVWARVSSARRRARVLSGYNLHRPTPGHSSGGPGRANSIYTGSGVTYANGGGKGRACGGDGYSPASGLNGGAGGVVLRIATSAYTGGWSAQSTGVVGSDKYFIFTSSTTITA